MDTWQFFPRSFPADFADLTIGGNLREVISFDSPHILQNRRITPKRASKIGDTKKVVFKI
jgi:hypothetical protein